MELSQLRYLRAIAHTGTFTAAAEAEGVAQPAVSKQIKLLERELGVALFERRARRVHVTQAGRVALHHAERALSSLDDMRRELVDLAGLARGRLRVCATETVMDYLLPAALADLHGRFPGMEVSAEMLGTDDAVALLLADEADVAIVALPLSHPELEIGTLFIEDVVLLAPRNDGLREVDRVALGDLRDREFVLSMPGHGLRAIVEAACARAGFVPKAKLEVRSQEAIIRLVERGAGLAFAPRLCMQGAARAVHVCAISDPPLRRRVGWAQRLGRHESRAVGEFLASLAKIVGESS